MKATLKRVIKNFIFNSKLADKIYTQRFIKNHYFPAENCYSPLVVGKELEHRKHIIWPDKYENTIPDIQLNEETQKKSLSIVEKRYAEGITFCNNLSNKKFTFDNPYFSIADGIVLHALLSHIKPKK